MSAPQLPAPPPDEQGKNEPSQGKSMPIGGKTSKIDEIIGNITGFFKSIGNKLDSTDSADTVPVLQDIEAGEDFDTYKKKQKISITDQLGLNNSQKELESRIKTKGPWVYNPFRWVQYILLWTNVNVIILAIAAVTVWFSVYSLSQREYKVIDLPPSISSQISLNTLDAGNDITIDINFLNPIRQFIYSSLNSMNTFDFEGPPKLEWLVGYVNPDIVTSVQERYYDNQKTIEQLGMIQFLAIQEISDVFVTKNKKRVTATIRGYLVRTKFPDGTTVNRPETLPYRARVVIVIRPISSKTIIPFYLLQVAEAAGEADVKRFDNALRMQMEQIGR